MISETVHMEIALRLLVSAGGRWNGLLLVSVNHNGNDR